MSDPFFQKKRKRTSPGNGAAGTTVRRDRPNGATAGRSKVAKPGPSRLRMRDKSVKGRSHDDDDDALTPGRHGEDEEDEEDDDDDDDDDDDGIEGMDLAHRYEADLQESDEDQQETPAEARVRLAKLYLESLKDEEVGEFCLAIAYD